ncbi:metal-sensitive transcriptional repressor [Leptospira fainei serovar Hurstbridge str. BUT 6]|uniref:Metal-sensitive transcriptional repressor n=1 Tax=Leptospira fainei serovar Hurstbridge str. BUT 6 TaxID=1193011 RepID=S3UU77_9LEPT|nr:metal-sensing transcriptional repressor [Leptospira fainei]EPG72813.1 metal-sensitive transcriptional repressor [Leptospira fainei serovar Hurstbridge str. BUT 6]
MKEIDVRTQLVHRIHRIKGQLEAIEKGLFDEETDCEKTLMQLKAASQALKKFGEAYMHAYMEKCFVERKGASNIRENVRKAIKTAFSL